MKKTILEHRVTSPKFEEERKQVLIKGEYQILDKQIEQLENLNPKNINKLKS